MNKQMTAAQVVAQLEDGMTIGKDHASDAERFHVTEQGVTLVVPEMLGQELHHVR